MLHFLHLPLRVLAGIAGATAIYAALFLYEDEQGKIENRLEEWWIRLDDQRNAAVSRNTAFMRGIARLATAGFDRLFGRRLVSVHAFGVSSALSMLTFWLLSYEPQNTASDSAPPWVTWTVVIATVVVLFANIRFSHSRIAKVAVFLPAIITFAPLGILQFS